MSELRKEGASQCYGCLCDTCANSVELPAQKTTIGEAENPCFSCDECRYYDGSWKKQSRHTEECTRYIEAKKVSENRAQNARATFKVIRGGKNE